MGVGSTHEGDPEAESGQETLARTPRSRGAPTLPKAVGRYRVLGHLGSGGMGIVLEAWDPRLDRPVAIKLLRPDAADGTGIARMAREAQALAQLSHPNVVAVYDVGTHDGELFIGMELVRGKTLAQWLATGPSWSDVLDLYVQAGRGLAAAHAAGLVHRDFKPSNVMVEERESSAEAQRRARVMDFGLARPVGPSTTSEPQPHPSHSGSVSSTSSHELTAKGAMMGTPAYMAPEQLRGEVVDARSDQFSFCVALYRGLYGQQPFGSGRISERIAHIARDDPEPPPAGSPVPGYVFDVLRRGMSDDPRRRYPEMSALLAALSVPPPNRRWLIPVGLAGAGAIAGLVVMPSAEEEPCTTQGLLEGTWDADAQDAVEAAMARVDAAYADVVRQRVQRHLDGYAEQWTRTHREICEATAIRGEQSEPQMDLRMGCLARARVELTAVVDVLRDADRDVVAGADSLLSTLPPPTACATLTERLQASPPDEQAASTLAVARAQRTAGLGDKARVTLESLRDEVGRGPFETQVELEYALVLEDLGEYGRAESSLREAMALATAHGLRPALSRAASASMRVVGPHRGRFEEALRFRDVAFEAADGDDELLVDAHRALGLVHRSLGDLDDAEAEQRRALQRLEGLGADPLDLARVLHDLAATVAMQSRHEDARALAERVAQIRREALGDDHPLMASTWSLLANVEFVQGRYVQAAQLHARARALREATLGPEHPETLAAWNNWANCLAAQGRYAEAEAEFRALVDIEERELGPAHPTLASQLGDLGSVLMRQGKLEASEPIQRRALKMYEETVGPEHMDTTRIRGNLGNLLTAMGRYDEAEAQHRRVVAATEAIYGPKHHHVASAYNNLGIALSHQGKDDELLEVMQRGLSIREELLPDEHPMVALSRSNVAEILLQLDRPLEALPLAERAWQRRQRDDIPAPYQISTAFVLARALWRARTDPASRKRARDLAKLALRKGEGLADPGGRIGDIRAWLKSPA